MPKIRLRAISTISICVSAFSGLLWGTAIAAIWVPVEAIALSDVQAAAATATTLAAVLWLARWHYDDERMLLIRAIGDLWERIPEDSRPPVLRPLP